MVLNVKKIINFLFVYGFISSVSWGMGAISPTGLVVYPGDEKGKASEQLVEMINSAQKTIEMGAYQVKDPKIVDALVKRASQGISIRLIVETNPYKHSFNAGDQDSFLGSLIKAGVKVHDRPDTLKKDYPNGHMHARYIIVDHQLFILTTGNFDEQTFDHCRDFAFVIKKNPETEKIFKIFKEIFEGDWDNKPVSILGDLPYIILGPEGQRAKFAQFLGTTNKKLQICQQYCNDPEMTKLLIDLRKKGVEIQLLMMANPTGYDSDPNQATQDELSAAGIEVRLVNINAKTYMHARGIIRDDKFALVGTTSLSPPSLDNNRELNLIITGNTVDLLAQQFAKDWLQALSLTEGRQTAREQKLDWNNLFFKE